MDDLGAAQFLARSVYRSFSTVSHSLSDSDRISWERSGMPEASRMPSVVPGDREDRSMRCKNEDEPDMLHTLILITHFCRVAFMVGGKPDFKVVSEDTPIQTVIQVKRMIFNK